MVSRRSFIKGSALAALALRGGSITTTLASPGVTAPGSALRCINVVNFIRLKESRMAMDMMLPVRRQMASIRAHGLPATWLLQFDALVDGPFVAFLKQNMAADHEVGFWFEMNQKHCAAAGLPWRGRPDYEWDPDPRVAFTIGYAPDERIRLADAAMKAFKGVWGQYPRSVASWNLDAVTVAHLATTYHVQAFATCRDQIATDGFTIWGSPIAGYYPSRDNLWSPALQRANQIDAPVFRMLGQDPVYYYDKAWTLPDGTPLHEPDTMEPVWTSGRSRAFVDGFLAMIARAPSLGFAYAQMGQENTFPWPRQEAAYDMQMQALAALRGQGAVHVETMEASGQRFSHAFKVTPAQAQVQLADPFGNTHPAQRSIWYQSRYYRANLHLRGNQPYLRDITVYSDRFEQPFLKQATKDTEVEQKLLAVMDGYHWSARPGSTDTGGFLAIDGKRVACIGEAVVSEEGQDLIVRLPLANDQALVIRFGEKAINFGVTGGAPRKLALLFAWDPAKAALRDVTRDRATYRWQGFDYAVRVDKGAAARTANGWSVQGDGPALGVSLDQPT